jgi:hypothetical protein
MREATRRLATLGVLTLAFGVLVAAQAGWQPPAWQPAVRGVLPGGPVFAPDRPKPTVGSVLDIESLVVAPSDEFRVERRNNFYKKDGSDGLYRWAASGHWSNYDEAKTGDWQKTIPDTLTMLNGQPVRDAATWRNARRPEIVRLLETWMYGKVPANAPKVVWTAGDLTSGQVNGIPTLTRTAVGRFVTADGSPYVDPAAQQTGRAAGPAAAPAPAAPARGVAAGTAQANAPGRGGRGPALAPNTIAVTYTIPAGATGRVPLVQAAGNTAQQVLAMGFGTVSFLGNGPNVTSGPGARDDWGAIRKYAWVVSRGLDYLETDSRVDAQQVALTGHSIGGKRALVAGAFDERIGLVFASCSGEGGASMMRRDWGETIDDLAQLSPQNYAEHFQYWVSRWSEMPIDAHMLVALMAPRPVFITGGTEDQWSDPVGVFWAGRHASPVYRLLGKRAIDIAAPPLPNTFVGHDLVFYNHVGGHITTPEETAKYLEMVKTFFRAKS